MDGIRRELARVEEHIIASRDKQHRRRARLVAQITTLKAALAAVTHQVPELQVAGSPASLPTAHKGSTGGKEGEEANEGGNSASNGTPAAAEQVEQTQVKLHRALGAAQELLSERELQIAEANDQHRSISVLLDSLAPIPRSSQPPDNSHFDPASVAHSGGPERPPAVGRGVTGGPGDGSTKPLSMSDL